MTALLCRQFAPIAEVVMSITTTFREQSSVEIEIRSHTLLLSDEPALQALWQVSGRCVE